jgi:hypothetical protein
MRDWGLMAKTDNRDAFEKILSSTLSRVLDLLKFAEAKNAALLTFSSAWVIATINLFAGDRTLPYGLATALGIALILFILAALIAVWSFLPKLELDFFHRDPLRAKNLLYFGDIAMFDAIAFRTRVRERYISADGSPATENYLDDLAIQVAVNSKIVKGKFVVFNIGAGLVVIALIAIAIPFLGVGVHWVLARLGVMG